MKPAAHPIPLSYASPGSRPKVEVRPQFVLAFTAALALVGGSIVIPRFSSPDPNAKFAAAANDIATLTSTLKHFKTDTGRYPTAAEGLDMLLTAPSNLHGWSGPYLDRMPNDPWGHTYVYTHTLDTTGSHFQVFSAGPDGIPGTADDVH